MFRKPSTDELIRRGQEAVRNLETVLEQCRAAGDRDALRAIVRRMEGLERSARIEPAERKHDRRPAH